MAASAIVFDFDGVIVESNAIKDEAFHDLYLPFGEEAAQQALRIHLANHGASRFEKFAMMHRAILGREITPIESSQFGEAFSRTCFERICRCPWVPGAPDVFTNLSSTRILAIVSATPEAELIRIVHARKLSELFRYCLGKPKSKVENLKEILLNEHLEPEKVVFVGDQVSDYDAAAAAGLRFVGRVPATVRSPFPCGTTLLASLADLPEAIENAAVMPTRSVPDSSSRDDAAQNFPRGK